MTNSNAPPLIPFVPVRSAVPVHAAAAIRSAAAAQPVGTVAPEDVPTDGAPGYDAPRDPLHDAPHDARRAHSIRGTHGRGRRARRAQHEPRSAGSRAHDASSVWSEGPGEIEEAAKQDVLPPADRTAATDGRGFHEPHTGSSEDPPGFASMNIRLDNRTRPMSAAAAFGAEDASDSEMRLDDPPEDMSRWLDFGPLAPYLADDGVTDVFVNGASGLWVDNGQHLARQGSWNADERSLRELAVRLISLGGRHIDEASPCVDVRLRDGMRVHAVLPPVSTSGTLLSIRVPRRARFRLDELAQAGTLSPTQVLVLRHAIASRTNLLVTGASGSGKTTLLSAILGDAPPDERIVTIEDVAELQVRHPHVVALEARQPNLEGAGGIGMERLLREALRMRPDRLVVGECRGAEIRELLGALNTGHDGGAGTLHANSLGDVPARIEALGALAGMSQEAVARQTVSAIGRVLHLEREGGVRSLAQIGCFRVDDRGHLAIEEVDATA